MFSSNTSQVAATASLAEAIDFDGTTDSLSSGSAIPDFTGTFSFWLWVPSGSAQPVYRELMTSGLEAVKFLHDGSSTLSITFYNSNGGQTQAGTVGVGVAVGTWTHILFSVDRTAAGSFPVYVNDIQSGTLTLSQDALATRNNVTLPRNNGSPSHGKLRLSNFLVRNGTYDFSNVANRRLFVTADLKPAAGQAALNPIIYLPTSDPTQPGLNAGTGGNFTLTGTVARSGRGPNQYNAPYSDLDGTADYLSRTTALTGLADGKTFTLSFVVNMDATISNYEAFTIRDGANQRLYVRFQSPNSFSVAALDSSPAYALLFTNVQPSGGWVAGRNYHVVMSFDVSNTGKRWVYINGEAASVTYTNYANLNIDFLGASPDVRVGSGAGSFMNGRLGALWFNTSYIDLSVPANLAKFVTGTGIDAKPVDLGANGELPTGTSPLIYLPMYGNNAGKNYGTGGDFSVNSGPYTGARGPNEYWGNKADFNGTTGYLSRTSALSGVSDGKTFSCSFYINFDSATSAPTLLAISSTSSNYRFRIFLNAARNLCILAYNSAGTMIIDATSATVLSTATNYYIQLSGDLSNSSKYMYINGTLDSTTWATFTNDTIQLSGGYGAVGGRPDGGASLLDGRISELYFSTTYIDFSQEANRLKFRDAFGNPTDLPSAITAGTVPNPAIYMRFPPTSFGTNYGTGGNFTVNGTITDGGQL